MCIFLCFLLLLVKIKYKMMGKTVFEDEIDFWYSNFPFKYKKLPMCLGASPRFFFFIDFVIGMLCHRLNTISHKFISAIYILNIFKVFASSWWLSLFCVVRLFRLSSFKYIIRIILLNIFKVLHRVGELVIILVQVYN